MILQSPVGITAGTELAELMVSGFMAEHVAKVF